MNKLVKTALVLGLSLPTLVLAGGGFGTDGYLKRFDLNNDGQVTQEEINKVKSEQFAKYDSDGNGILSSEEWQAMRQDRVKERMARRFAHHDSNGDGGISQEEFMSRATHMMDRLDSNGDHVIDKDELGCSTNGRHHGGGYGYGHHHGGMGMQE